jgi:hypothetical protein
MRKPLLGLVILFLAPALASGQAVNAPDRLRAAQPQSPPSGESDWGNLRQLRVGDKVEVVRYNLSKHKGKMLAWTEESISLRLKNQDVTIPREEVYRVTWLSKSKRGRNALIGLVVGAGVGAVLGATIRGDLGADDPTAAAVAASLTLGGIGAGVGAAFPSHPTIYRAPRRKSENGK